MNRHSNFGFSSILLTFVMICIITFSALTLLTANSDYKLSKKAADRNSAYYEAEQSAYDLLSDIDRMLLQTYMSDSTVESYYSSAEEALSESGIGTWSFEDGQYFFTYKTDITEDQYLLVKLEICYPQNTQDQFLRIVKWQSIHITQTMEDQTLNLIGSDQ